MLRKCAPEKAVVYTIVVVLAGMVVGVLFATVMATVGLAPQLAMPG